MSEFFNLGSLILGAIAWLIPLFEISQLQKGHEPKNHIIYSFTACSIALVFQLLEIRRYVIIQDISGIMDTVGAVSIVSFILVVITFVLNIIVNNLRSEGNN